MCVVLNLAHWSLRTDELEEWEGARPRTSRARRGSDMVASGAPVSSGRCT
jgi:hypothetical protein